VRRMPKPVGPGVFTGSVGAALTLNAPLPAIASVAMPSPVSGAPFCAFVYMKSHE
jgi:hypothetical protein